jgi:hypothetical protein
VVRVLEAGIVSVLSSRAWSWELRSTVGGDQDRSPPDHVLLE